MKNSELNYDSTSTNFISGLTETTTEIPFHVSFSHENRWVNIQLVNGIDVLKLADVFADMLKKNNIDYVITKSE